jgi:hypothetical protein
VGAADELKFDAQRGACRGRRLIATRSSAPAENLIRTRHRWPCRASTAGAQPGRSRPDRPARRTTHLHCQNSRWTATCSFVSSARGILTKLNAFRNLSIAFKTVAHIFEHVQKCERREMHPQVKSCSEGWHRFGIPQAARCKQLSAPASPRLGRRWRRPPGFPSPGTGRRTYLGRLALPVR